MGQRENSWALWVILSLVTVSQLVTITQRERERDKNKSLSIDVVPHQLKKTDYSSDPENGKALCKVQ